MKIKALAEEARIIRFEERRRPHERGSLLAHRVGVVRSEQRYSLLAYAFIRGRSYGSCEQKCRRSPDLARVLRIVRSFGNRNTTEHELQCWFTDAGPCGRQPGVMTSVSAGSTPVASSMAG